MSPQTKQAERDKLHKTLNEIANDLRGKVDGWDFKAYVLGTLFYRYLCEHLVHVINTEQIAAGAEDFDYANLPDEEAEGAREHYTNMLGYYIVPSQLFDALEKAQRRTRISTPTSPTPSRRWRSLRFLLIPPMILRACSKTLTSPPTAWVAARRNVANA